MEHAKHALMFAGGVWLSCIAIRFVVNMAGLNATLGTTFAAP